MDSKKENKQKKTKRTAIPIYIYLLLTANPIRHYSTGTSKAQDTLIHQGSSTGNTDIPQTKRNFSAAGLSVFSQGAGEKLNRRYF